jgi:ATP-dependent Lon protease
MDNGAKRAPILVENKRDLLDFSAEILEHMDSIFYGDPKAAVMKVLGGM